MSNHIKQYFKENNLDPYIDKVYCVLCWKQPSDFHHIENSYRGKRKGEVVPLCRECHMFAHSISRKDFKLLLDKIYEKYGTLTFTEEYLLNKTIQQSPKNFLNLLLMYKES